MTEMTMKSMVEVLLIFAVIATKHIKGSRINECLVIGPSSLLSVLPKRFCRGFWERRTSRMSSGGWTTDDIDYIWLLLEYGADVDA